MQQIILKSSRGKWLFCLVSGILLLLAGVVIKSSSLALIGSSLSFWIGNGIVIIAVVVILGGFLLFLFPGVVRLEIKPEGVTIFHFNVRQHYSWNELDEFHVLTLIPLLPFSSFVVMQLTSEKSNTIPGAKLARMICKGEILLMDTYGLRAPELAKLLKEYKQSTRLAS